MSSTLVEHCRDELAVSLLLINQSSCVRARKFLHSSLVYIFYTLVTRFELAHYDCLIICAWQGHSKDSYCGGA